jgi:hypothetical protein
MKRYLYHLADCRARPDLVRVCYERFSEFDLDPAAIGTLRMEPPASSLSGCIQYALVANAINYQFWEPLCSESAGELPIARYDYEGVVGAMGMQRALAKAWDGYPTAAHFARALREEGIIGLFGGIPRASDRKDMLAEVLGIRPFEPTADLSTLEAVTKVLLERVTEEHALSVSDAAFIALAFPTAYGRDPLLKRAQLALSFIAAFAREGFGQEVQLDVTLFADYQVPRVARALGLLEYGPELAQLVDSGALLQAGGVHEQAIRSATLILGRDLIRAVELEHGVRINEADLDQWLWGQRNACGDSLFHRTATTDY